MSLRTFPDDFIAKKKRFIPNQKFSKLSEQIFVDLYLNFTI